MHQQLGHGDTGRHRVDIIMKAEVLEECDPEHGEGFWALVSTVQGRLSIYLHLITLPTSSPSSSPS